MVSAIRQVALPIVQAHGKTLAKRETINSAHFISKNRAIMYVVMNAGTESAIMVMILSVFIFFFLGVERNPHQKQLSAIPSLL